MSFSRYPNAATLSLIDSGTLNTYGVFTPGATHTVVLKRCRLETNGSGRYVIGANGDRIDLAATLFAPMTSLVIPSGSVIQVLGRKYTVVNIPYRQKYLEIQVK